MVFFLQMKITDKNMHFPSKFVLLKMLNLALPSAGAVDTLKYSGEYCTK